MINTSQTSAMNMIKTRGDSATYPHRHNAFGFHSRQFGFYICADVPLRNCSFTPPQCGAVSHLLCAAVACHWTVSGGDEHHPVAAVSVSLLRLCLRLTHINSDRNQHTSTRNFLSTVSHCHSAGDWTTRREARQSGSPSGFWIAALRLMLEVCLSVQTTYLSANAMSLSAKRRLSLLSADNLI